MVAWFQLGGSRDAGWLQAEKDELFCVYATMILKAQTLLSGGSCGKSPNMKPKI